MENNEDTNTNMMNQLTDDMVIQIFEHFENLADLLTLPKVNHRFNELSKLKCSRNHLVLKDDVIAAYSVEKLQMKMEEEINKCKDLKSVTVAISHPNSPNFSNDYLELMKSMFIRALNGNTVNEINENDIDFLRVYNREFSLASYCKKNAGDMSRVVKIAPSGMTNIDTNVAPKLFQTAVEKISDTLTNVKYRGTNITYAHLITLGKCKELRRVHLTGDLIISEEVPEAFQNIKSKIITLNGNFHCPHVPDLFFSETIHTFSVYYSTIKGFENELATKCSKLKMLNINMESEREDIHNDQVVDSVTELLYELKEHRTLEEICFNNASQHMSDSLREPVDAWVMSMRENGEQVTALFSSDIIINIDRNQSDFFLFKCSL